MILRVRRESQSPARQPRGVNKTAAGRASPAYDALW